METKPNSEIFFGHPYEILITNQINMGFNNLVAISGFASGAIISHLLVEHPDLSIKLIIGMASITGISSSDHCLYKSRIAEHPNRFQCYYYSGEKGVHVKAYAWLRNGSPQIGLIGSPNLSWNGLNKYFEALVKTRPEEILAYFESLRQHSPSVLSEQAEKEINIFTPSLQTAPRTTLTHGTAQADALEDLISVNLSLLSSRGEIHPRSGLNWGQREGREPNQAYIPVQSRIHQEFPGFFPPAGQRFSIQTDDEETLVCVIAQAGDKAIETPENNSVLGVYFRRRIGIPLGNFIRLEDLKNYGRTDVDITKIDDDLFLMDFSIS